MTKVEIANELLKNSTSVYQKELIKKYIESIDKLDNKCINKELIRFDNCISYFLDEKFDITGWMLFDIPIFYSHCFWNTKSKQAFDLAVWNIGEIIPRYLDSEADEQDAKTIQEAIEKYDVRDYLNSGR